LRGLIALLIGIAVGLIGIDQQTGAARFTFGSIDLLDGINIVVVVVGLFAVGEAIYLASRTDLRGESVNLKGPARMSKEDWARSWKPWLRGSFIGFPLGALPAGGTELPTFISYQAEKRLSKHPEEFGHGAIEGVAGPEAANNSAVAGVLVPLLTLGLPTSATAAIMLAAFQQYGIQPGPLLFTSNADLVWGLIASLFIGNAMLLVLNLPLAGIWARLLFIPRHWLYAGILVFAVLGVYGVNRSVFEIGVLGVFGLLGYAMRKLDFPVAPVIVGMILGPMAEVQFRRAIQITQGDLTIFVTRPISLTLLLIAAAVLFAPLIKAALQRPR
jgi:putative tricarboxylic transport membrane protein